MGVKRGKQLAEKIKWARWGGAGRLNPGVGWHGLGTRGGGQVLRRERQAVKSQQCLETDLGKGDEG